MLVDSTGITDYHSGQMWSNIHPNDLQYQPCILGKGNGGVVRKAVHVPTNQPVAVKIINVYDREKRHQLYNELKQLKAMNCDSLLKCYGAFFQEGSVRLLFEYMDLSCLETLIAVLKMHNTSQGLPLPTPFIPEPLISRVVLQILNGLNYLHNVKK